MNQDDTRNFIVALNTIAEYVPPLLMGRVMGNPVCRILEGIANGQLTFSIGSPMPTTPPPEQKAGNGLDADAAAHQPEAPA